MPNYNGVWSLTTQLQYASTWQGDNVAPFAQGLISGGKDTDGVLYNVTQSINVASAGNAVDFGDASAAHEEGCGFGNSTKAVIHLGYFSSAISSTVEVFTFGSAGDAVDFGDRSVTISEAFGNCNDTIGHISGGINASASNVIDRFVIASGGTGTSAASDATDSITPAASIGLFAGGYGNNAYNNVIDRLALASAGNATDFGDLTAVKLYVSNGGAASTTRGVWAGGVASGNRTNVIEYVTIASAGNATDFGDILAAVEGMAGCSNSTRGIFAGGAS